MATQIGSAARIVDPHVALHAFAAQHRDELLERTVGPLLAAHPERPRAEVVGNLPHVLDEIIAAMADGEAAAPADATPLRRPPTDGDSGRIAVEAQGHGLDRHRRGFGIASISRGFGLIWDAITGLAVERGVTFPAQEFQLLHRCIDAAIAAAIEEYWTASRAEVDRSVAARMEILAHDLRNSLGSATLAFDAIQSGQVGPMSRTASILGRSLDHMNALLAHTMTEVHLRTGVDAERRSIELASVLRDVAAAAAPRNGVTLTVEVDELLELRADPHLLTSAVTNLVQNAVKFTRPSGQIALRGWQAGDQVVIVVEDECGGLQRGADGLVLDPFATADGDAAGHGLALTREAMTAHGGTVEVEDRAPTGCTFTLRFPVR